MKYFPEETAIVDLNKDGIVDRCEWTKGCVALEGSKSIQKKRCINNAKKITDETA